MGENARIKAELTYDKDKIRDQIMSVYKGML